MNPKRRTKQRLNKNLNYLLDRITLFSNVRDLRIYILITQKYQGVKEFHMLARIGCYYKAMCIRLQTSMLHGRMRTARTLTVGGWGCPGQKAGWTTPLGPDHLSPPRPCDLSHDAFGVTPPPPPHSLSRVSDTPVKT